MSALARIEARDRAEEGRDREVLTRRLYGFAGLDPDGPAPFSAVATMVGYAVAVGRLIGSAEVDGEACCRVCGCTDDHACEGGCWWVQPDLCSQCGSGDEQ